MKIRLVVMMMGTTSVFAQSPRTDDAIVKHYAEYMNVSDTVLCIPELYEAIHAWIGTPYRYGRSDRKGTDCSGFVRNIIYPLCGEELPRSASGISQVICPKTVSELKEGDLVFFNYYGRFNSHVGIYLQNGWFVHASTVRGVTLNNLYTAYYTQRFSKGGSLKRGELKDLIMQTQTLTDEDEDGTDEWKHLLLEPLIPLSIKNLTNTDRNVRYIVP